MSNRVAKRSSRNRLITTFLLTALGATVAEAGDFNGDGFDDAAFGVPYEDVGGGPIVDAGCVNIVYGSGGGLATAATGGIASQVWTQNSGGIPGSADSDDLFGASLASGDLNGDGFDDLVIGVPGEDTGGNTDVGAVHVIYGGTGAGGALGSGGSFVLTSFAWGEARETGDEFGRTVAVGDFDGDGFDDIVIGCPLEGVGANSNAGMLHIAYGQSAGGITAGPTFTQSMFGDPEEFSDELGFSLAVLDVNGDGFTDVAIGVPYEDYVVAGSPENNVGMVCLLEGAAGGIDVSPTTPFFIQSSLGHGNSSEVGDCFGYSLAGGDIDGDLDDELVVGIPFEGIAAAIDCGVVDVVEGSPAGLVLGFAMSIPESLFGPGVSNFADAFGTSVAVGDFDLDGFGDIAIGKPGEEVAAGPPDLGEVTILYGAAGGPGFGGSADWGQNTPGILETAEVQDFLGIVVAVGDFNGDGFADLIAVADEDVGTGAAGVNAGLANVLYGGGGGISAAGDQIWHQNRPGVGEAIGGGDAFGLASDG